LFHTFLGLPAVADYLLFLSSVSVVPSVADSLLFLSSVSGVPSVADSLLFLSSVSGVPSVADSLLFLSSVSGVPSVADSLLLLAGSLLFFSALAVPGSLLFMAFWLLLVPYCCWRPCFWLFLACLASKAVSETTNR
jgi:hypothetical protein